MIKLRFTFYIIFIVGILLLIVAFIFLPNKKVLMRVPCISNEMGNVTRIIHQSWKDRNIPSFFQRYLPSWNRCFPHWEFKFWTDKDNRNLVVNHFPWFLETYDNYPKEIYRADAARYLYLYYYGGIYTDLDNECLIPFEHLLQNYTFVFGTIDKVDRQTDLVENYVQNSFMYSRPRQTFWLEVINNLQSQFFYDTPDIVTGPEHLCSMIHNYRKSCPNDHSIKIYDAWYFNPFSWGGIIKYKHCKIYNQMTDEEWKKCRNIFLKNGSYVVQYHAHTWDP